MKDLELLRLIQEEKAKRMSKNGNGKHMNITVEGDLHLGKARVNGNGYHHWAI